MFYTVQEFEARYPEIWELGNKSPTFRWVSKASSKTGTLIATHKTERKGSIYFPFPKLKKEYQLTESVAELAHEMWHSLERIEDDILDERYAYAVQCRILMQLKYKSRSNYLKKYIKGYLEGDVFKYHPSVLRAYEVFYSDCEHKAAKMLRSQSIEFFAYYIPRNR